MTNEPFYNRREELEYLTEKFRNLVKGEFIVFYGRRRLGKTRLIKRFMEIHKNEKTLYVFVNLQEEKNLMESFSQDIFNQLGVTLKIERWVDLFNYIFDMSKKHKLLFVIDEFQRLNSLSPSFITELQNQWDSRLKNNKILLIIVGSSIGMMRRIALSGAGALYGRKTGQMQLLPFRYVDFRKAFKRFSEEEKILWYSVFGGTPFYFEVAKSNKDLLESIKKNILFKNAPLRDEPKELLEIEFRTIARYNSILQAIAAGKENIKEISDITKIVPQTLPAYIENLIRLMNLVDKIEPVLGKKRMSRYVLNDNFFKFWYKFVLPNLSVLELDNIKSVVNKIKTELSAYTGKVFEDIIKELFRLYNGSRIKDIELDFTKIGSWWDRTGKEIDIIIKNKNELILGEIKWTNKPMDINILNNLIEKAKFVKYRGKVRYVLVSKKGFTGKCLELVKKTNTLTLDIKEIEKLFDNV